MNRVVRWHTHVAGMGVRVGEKCLWVLAFLHKPTLDAILDVGELDSAVADSTPTERVHDLCICLEGKAGGVVGSQGWQASTFWLARLLRRPHSNEQVQSKQDQAMRHVNEDHL